MWPNSDVLVIQVMANITSWSFADYVRQRVDVNRTHSVDYYNPSHMVESHDSGTTHLSVHSPEGAAVAVTSTVNSVYASDVIIFLIVTS